MIELAYIVIAIEAWTWAASQVKYAINEHRRGVPFRWTKQTWRDDSALWLVVKAIFFTYVGSVWWFDYFHAGAHEAVAILFAVMHTKAFLHWRRLPEEVTPVAEPPVVKLEELKKGGPPTT